MIRYTELKQENIAHRTHQLEFSSIQRALLVGTLVCAILSLIPSLGFVGSLSVRSLSVVTMSVQVIHSLKNEEKRDVLLPQILRLASVTLGLSGVALHMNQLVTTGIVLDILFHLIETGKGAQQKDLYKALSHLTFILIDAFAMTAMLAGGWQFAVTAASISAAAMLLFGLKAIRDYYRKNDLNYIFDAVCYFALMGIGIAGAVRAAEIITHSPENAHFVYKNETYKTVTLYDKNFNVVARVEPGQTVSITVSGDNTFFNGYYQFLATDNLNRYGDASYIICADQTFKTIVIQAPMTVDEFPTLPVGSSAVVTQDPRWDRGNPFLVNENFMQFLNPTLPDRHIAAVTQEGESAIIFQNDERSVSLDRDSSGRLSQLIHNLAEDVEGSFILPLPCNTTTFNRIIQYFLVGTLDLTLLNEQELIDLSHYAAYLEMERLSPECTQEIARRLFNFEWENLELLRRRQAANRHLHVLTNLFQF